MKKKQRIQMVCAISCCLFAVSACGDPRNHEDNLQSVTIQDMDAEEREGSDEENETVKDESMEEVSAEESDKESAMINDPSSETLQEDMRAAERVSWQELYYDKVKDNDLWELCLMDINFDKMPELFIIYLEGTGANVSIQAGYSFEDDEVVWIEFGEFSVPNDIFVPYRNKDSGKIVWVVDSVFRATFNEYIWTWLMYDFDDLSHVERTLIFQYTETINEDGSKTYIDMEGDPISFTEVE